jgi:hypothetical protein
LPTTAPTTAPPPRPNFAPGGADRQPASPREAARERFDRQVDSGMVVVIDAEPRSAFLVVDGRVIGRADEVVEQGGYTLPSPGPHRVVLRSPGYQEARLLVQAREDGPRPTRVRVALSRAAAGELAIEDLPRHRVREEIGFRVQPRTTRLLVDGELKGPAIQFNGRGGRWLKLPRGLHRVSLVAPGHQQVDLAIEVGGGAIEQREVIRLELPEERP